MNGSRGSAGNLVSPAMLRRARDEFAYLLQRRTPERQWQDFFANNPQVLSLGLPLQLLPCDIVPLGRPGRSEPDFLIHPGSPLSRRIHGIVELKTNYARITTHGRKPELVLSRDAAIAERQLKTYDELYDSFAPSQRLLALDSRSHLFVVMGSSDELMNLEEELRPQLKEILPPGIRFLTFDELFRSYSTEVPKPVALLRRAIPPSEEIVSWLSFARETKVSTVLHRVASEAYSASGSGAAQRDEANFRHQVEMLFSRPPHVQSRFQAGGRPVLYATTDFEAAFAELEAQLPQRNKLRFSSRRRYRHFVFEYSGRIASLPDDSGTRELMRAGDFRASQLFAEEAIDAGFDAISYPSPTGPGSVYAIFSPMGIGKTLDSRPIDFGDAT